MNMLLRRRALLGGKKYLFVNYIESHGSEYIRTGIKTKRTQKYEVEYSDVGDYGTTAQDNQRILETGYSYKYVVMIKEHRFGYVSAKANGQQGSDMQIGTNGTISNNGYHRIVTLSNLYGKLVLKNGSTTIGTWEATSSNVDGDDNLYELVFLNRNWNDGTITDRYGAKCRVYGFKVWENNVLIRNFKPCIRLKDNAVGMYDEVTGQFYGNAGTGAFTYG